MIMLVGIPIMIVMLLLTRLSLLMMLTMLQLAQPIRLLLEYTGTKFEDRLLACGPAPSFDKSCWLNQKVSRK